MAPAAFGSSNLLYTPQAPRPYRTMDHRVAVHFMILGGQGVRNRVVTASRPLAPEKPEHSSWAP